MLTYKDLLELEGCTNKRQFRKLRRRAEAEGVPLHHWLFQQHYLRLKQALAGDQPNAEFTHNGIRYLIQPTRIAARTLSVKPVIEGTVIGYLKNPVPVRAPRMLLGFLRPGTEGVFLPETLTPIAKPTVVYNLSKWIDYNSMMWEQQDKQEAEAWKVFRHIFLPKVTNPQDGPLLA